jgi:pimeloyl-ACP methyl ester carboxylesterase
MVTEPVLALTRLAGRSADPVVLVVGPSLGTSVEALWTAAAAHVGNGVEVVGWDLPGHGRSRPAEAPFTVTELAAVVRAISTQLAGDRRAFYAGVSLGGAVGLELAIDPGPFSGIACIASAYAIGEPAAWRDRAILVRRAGRSAVMVSASAQRWFAPGFLDRDRAAGDRLLQSLADADAESYALACEALATFDIRHRLSGVKVPLVLAPGEVDVVVPPALAQDTANASPGATTHVLAGCAHLPPVEDPHTTAELLRSAYFQEAAP